MYYISLVKNIKFKSTSNSFQHKLLQDTTAIKTLKELLVKADKISNYYKMDIDRYNELLSKHVTKNYKLADTKVI